MVFNMVKSDYVDGNRKDFIGAVESVANASDIIEAYMSGKTVVIHIPQILDFQTYETAVSMVSYASGYDTGSDLVSLSPIVLYPIENNMLRQPLGQYNVFVLNDKLYIAMYYSESAV